MFSRLKPIVSIAVEAARPDRECPHDGVGDTWSSPGFVDIPEA